MDEKAKFEWVRKNCKFAQFDPPMSDPNVDNAPNLPEGPGVQSKNLPRFNALFQKYLAEGQLQQEFDAFKTQKGIQPGAQVPLSMAFNFMAQGDDMPSWAPEFCPGHDFQVPSYGDGYRCTVCGDHLDSDFDSPPEREQEDTAF